jgi:O-succinylbenzoic acid--CoA ligase
VRVSLTPKDTLAVTAPHLGIELLETNDLADILPNGQFRILGRVDSVINSGGIKIQAEDIERYLQASTGLQLIALPAPHPVLGQCVALLWEGPAEAEQALHTACATLPRYQQPHHILHTPLPRTESGKPARSQAAQLLATLL